MQKIKLRPLFPNSRGNSIKDDIYRKYLAKVSQEVLGKRITPHDFRHSLVTNLKMMKVPEKDIMALTGHCEVKVLNKVYSHTTPEGRTKALEASGF